MKTEWRKQEKNLYLPGQKPEVIAVPKLPFFMIGGSGNPNGETFAQKTAALYALSYAVRMMPKQGYTPQGYEEYTVYPLEGVWDLSMEGRKQDRLNKDELVYTIMIRQPAFVTAEVAQRAMETAIKKKSSPYLNEVRFGEWEDGLCVQMMHVGPYDSEAESFAKMTAFAKENCLERIDMTHREIYLGDPRKTAPEKLQTVLRFKVGTKY